MLSIWLLILWHRATPAASAKARKDLSSGPWRGAACAASSKHCTQTRKSRESAHGNAVEASKKGKAHYARRDGSFKLFADRIRLTCTGPGAHLFAELARSERRRATRRTVDLLLGGQSWAHSPGRSQELL